MPRTALALLLALAVAAPAGAQQPPETRALLQKVGEAYRALTSYHYQGRMVIRMVGAGMDQGFEVPVVLAAERSGRARVEVRHPQMGMTTVSDGKQTTTYLPTLGQYTRKPAETPAAGATGMPLPLQGSPILRYFNPLDGYKSGEVTGSQPVAVGARTRDCWVVRCDFTPPAAIATDSTARSVTTFWVDKARSVILHDSTAVTMRNPATGANLEMSQATAWDVARIDEPLADSLFAFTPPADAKEVQSFSMPGAQQAESELVGQKAPPFTLTDLKGRSVSLAAYKGRVVVLDFWATWCRPCRIEMPRVQSIYQDLKPKGLVVLGVNYAESPETVKSFMEQNPSYTFPILLDKTAAVADKYKAEAIPTLVVVGRDGLIKAWYQGVREEQVLRDAVAKAMASGPAPARPAVRSAAPAKPKAATTAPKTAAPKPAPVTTPKK